MRRSSTRVPLARHPHALGTPRERPCPPLLREARHAARWGRALRFPTSFRSRSTRSATEYAGSARTAVTRPVLPSQSYTWRPRDRCHAGVLPTPFGTEPDDLPAGRRGSETHDDRRRTHLELPSPAGNSAQHARTQRPPCTITGTTASDTLGDAESRRHLWAGGDGIIAHAGDDPVFGDPRSDIVGGGSWQDDGGGRDEINGSTEQTTSGEAFAGRAGGLKSPS